MEPVEINAGQWYLRALRADDRIDDRTELAALGLTDPDHVARSVSAWSTNSGYTWAVCDVTTGELVAEITLDPGTGQIATRARDGQTHAAAAAAQSVSRFAASVLGPEPHS